MKKVTAINPRKTKYCLLAGMSRMQGKIIISKKVPK